MTLLRGATLALTMLATLAACGGGDATSSDRPSVVSTNASPEPPATPTLPPAKPGKPGNEPGRHDHRLTVAGTQREVIVYVPDKARAGAAPTVLMLHGTSGDGQRFYEVSGWREKADETGLIAVFPTALVHCYKEDENRDGDFSDKGEHKATTKWAAGKLGSPALPLCTDAELAELPAERRARADHPPADDLAYLAAILDLLDREYAVAADRVYASGFSNGASMAARLALQLSDRIAAVGVNSGGLDLPPTPVAASMRVLHTYGTDEDNLTAALGVRRLVPSPDLLDRVPVLRSHAVDPMRTMLGLPDRHVYAERTVSGATVATFAFGDRYQLLVVDRLHHQYPNGSNHPVVMADLLWNFFTGQV